jgi:hypothetical protein
LANRHLAASTSTRLPLVVRTLADVAALRANSRAVRRLPADGLKIAIEGLHGDVAQQLPARISAYVRACGCAEGGAFALIALVGVFIFIALRIHHQGAHWSDFGITAIGVLLAVLVGGMGKALGLMIARLRFERCCEEVIQRIENT